MASTRSNPNTVIRNVAILVNQYLKDTFGYTDNRFIKANQDQPQPVDYPFATFLLTTVRNTTNQLDNIHSELIASSNPLFTYDVLEQKVTSCSATLSISSYSTSDVQALRLIQDIQFYLTYIGYIELSKIDTVFLNNSSITKIDFLEIDDREHRYTCDLEMRYSEIVDRVVETIETVSANINPIR